MSISLFNVRIDDFTTLELDKALYEYLNSSTPHSVFTPNAEMLLEARTDKIFADILNKADLSLPDSVSLRFAAAAYGNILKNRNTGTDTLYRLARLCSETEKRLVLFGGDPGVAEKTAEYFKHLFLNLDVVAIDPGYVQKQDDGSYIKQHTLDMLLKIKPVVLAVALGQKKQEEWILDYLLRVPSLRIAIGVGGAFDMYSGVHPRAPKWMRELGFEWLWRVYIEPRRIKRIIRASIVFPVIVAYDTLIQGRFLRGCFAVFKEVASQLLKK